MAERLDVTPSSPVASPVDALPPIQVVGARTHNLQGIDVEIPQNRLVVVTGPSGSGKSSLAFDTLFAEGQRQYIETLSVYARQFMPQMERPAVDEIRQLPPTICVDQRQGAFNPRSTVGTVTEIYDYLRVLMARFGLAHCYQCGVPIAQQTPEELEQRVLELPEGTKAIFLAPLVRGRKGEHRDTLASVRKSGLVRVRVNGEIHDVDHLPDLNPKQQHTIEAVVDRVVIRAGIEARVSESARLALEMSDGVLGLCYEKEGQWVDEFLSTRYACPNCNVNIVEIEPRSFSFNSPFGACPDCDGLGVSEQFDADMIFADRSLAPSQGGIFLFGETAAARKKLQKALAKSLTAQRWNDPLSQWSADELEMLWSGREQSLGLRDYGEKIWATTTDPDQLDHLRAFRSRQACSSCGGSRLRAEAMSVELDGHTIQQIVELPVERAILFFEAQSWTNEAARRLGDEILRRLQFLDRVGLTYLSLSRSADSLSGGELQRVRLATCIGSGLVGACYVLDEPSIGLHPRDTDRLIECVRELRDQGNTVVVVEHDESIIRAADHVIDIGPGAAAQGGRLVAAGTPDEVAANDQSPTGRFLSRPQRPSSRHRVPQSDQWLRLTGASLHNLREVNAEIPLGLLSCVTGVSGSGKSSLIVDTLVPALRRELGAPSARPGPFQRLEGASLLQRVVPVDQSPIGRSSRSNPATYCGVFDDIRKIFAATREAKQRGFNAARFSFNVAAGRCADCQGLGVQRIEMNFLPDQFVACGTCAGRRFNRQTLAVRYRDRSIADVLELSISEAVDFFASFSSIHQVLEAARSVGLGYLRLGQASNTLSGGEAQRLKLATFLGRADATATLFVLDEPTTGLHLQDVERLLGVLNGLVDAGNSVLVIEHHTDVIGAADWVIDMGPEGGVHGGEIVVTGPPETIRQAPRSITAAWI